MPAPAVVGVYVLAAVGSVAAGLAFKEFVYEPHIAPRVERWAEEFLAKRQARRARRAVAVPAECNYNLGDDAGTDAGTDADAGDGKSTYELESLVENEVRQWRAQVGEGSGLRHRKRVPAPGVGSLMAGSALDESNILIPYFPMSPTHVHVLFDPATDALSVADTDSHSVSGASSRVPTPAPSSSLLSRLTFRTPPPQPAVGRAPPTPEPSVRGRGSPAPSLPRTPVPTLNNTQAPDAFDASNTYAYTYAGAGGAAAFTSPHHVPSLSLSHPLDPDEQDVELLSAPSSSAPSERADPPFSELSRAHSQSSHSPFVLSPEFRTLSSVSSPVHSPFILSSELGTFSPDMGLRTLSSSSESGSELGEGDEAWSQIGRYLSMLFRCPRFAYFYRLNSHQPFNAPSPQRVDLNSPSACRVQINASTPTDLRMQTSDQIPGLRLGARILVDLAGLVLLSRYFFLRRDLLDRRSDLDLTRTSRASAQPKFFFQLSAPYLNQVATSPEDTNLNLTCLPVINARRWCSFAAKNPITVVRNTFNFPARYPLAQILTVCILVPPGTSCVCIPRNRQPFVSVH